MQEAVKAVQRGTKMMQGTIATVVEERGFGFVRPDAYGKDLFFHISAWMRQEFLAFGLPNQAQYRVFRTCIVGHGGREGDDGSYQ
jgi:hypothetical protein